MKIFFLVSTILLSLAAAGAELIFKTYPVRFSDPEDTAKIIRQMHSSTNQVQVQPIGHTLAVKGTAEQHEEVRQMLSELDTPPNNIQIHVQFNSSRVSSGLEAGVQQRGPIIIRNGDVRGSLAGQLGSRNTTATENITTMLVTMDGKTASLRVGEQVPQLTWLVEYGRRHGYVIETEIEWVDVGAFLTVKPTIVGPGLIRVQAFPEISGRTGDGTKQRIQFIHLATEVTVADGQTVHIGGFSQDQEFHSHFFIGSASGGGSSVTDLTLTPLILE